MAKLYHELAKDWYRLLTPVEGYEEEAVDYHRILGEHAAAPINTMLELGCGAGHNAHFMKQWYALTLTDLSEEMLALSQEINQDCEHFQGDMRTLRLEKTFDAVFIHDAIMYMTSESDLHQALETAFVHLKPGGILLISPDCVRETFEPFTKHGGSDGSNKSLRYLEWCWMPDPQSSIYYMDFAYMLRDEAGDIEVESERHEFGVFPKNTWMGLLKSVGFNDVRIVSDKFRDVNFVCLKP